MMSCLESLLKKVYFLADQTPTPTRFIRNCEEVGLFQDLQNVNPFDEFFKKAVEVAKNGGSLVVPEAQSDDTLHTPHILPHIEESQKNINSTNRDDNISESNDFSLNNVISITPATESVSESNARTAKPNPTPDIITIDDDSNVGRDIKERIKEALQMKEKQRTEKTIQNNSNHNTITGNISVVPIKNLTEERNGDFENSTIAYSVDTNIKEKVREMNRAAQVRCRKRKQERWKLMEEEILRLRKENKNLKMENAQLKSSLSLFIAKESGQGAIIGTLIPVADPPPPKKDDSQKLRDLSQAFQFYHHCQNKDRPKSTSIPSTPTPIVIQLIPNAVDLAVSVSQSLSKNNVGIKRNGTNNSTRLVTNNQNEQKKVKRKGNRKIVPKIIIEN
ncbi:hypothetical protein NQ317_011043 [Molorchus minor]|uniref:BZIP domain-containing protein n=1 Tax=Molorchus minor TaxID=1323400 RepID=A0ABQ9IYW2_9CUCU|nr:hypothetical protein NQ317_011043 [Molorchus minor]